MSATKTTAPKEFDTADADNDWRSLNDDASAALSDVAAAGVPAS